MRLAEALVLRRELGTRYYVRRSGIRSPGIGPYAVAIQKGRYPPWKEWIWEEDELLEDRVIAGR